MSTLDARAELWESERPRLTALAYRILGSWQDAEDVVAQSWARLAGQEEVQRPQAWLTTAVTRLAIDAGRRARARRETYVGQWLPEPVDTARLPHEVVEARALLDLGVLRLMDALEPQDRAIFVLREAFALPYAENGECVGRSPAACRQVVSRARTTLRHQPAGRAPRGPGLSQEDARVMTALVHAVIAGDPEGVLALLAPDCTLHADSGGNAPTVSGPIHGAQAVARLLLDLRRFIAGEAAQVNINGGTGLLFTTEHGTYLYVLERNQTRITGIQVHANPAKLTTLPHRP